MHLFTIPHTSQLLLEDTRFMASPICEFLRLNEVETGRKKDLKIIHNRLLNIAKLIYINKIVSNVIFISCILTR